MKRLFSALFFLVISTPVLAYDQFSLSAGFDYTTGKYGNAESTEILYIPVTGTYESGKLTLKLTVPYIRVSGPGGVVPGFGRMDTSSMGTGSVGMGGGGGSTTSTNSGLGDVVTSAGYEIYSTKALALDVVGKIKFGTADADKGLGTGQNDYSAQVDGYYTLHQETTLFATVGYKVVGEPSWVTTNNVVYGVLGLDQKLSSVTNAGVMLNVVQSATAASSNQQDVTVYASQKLSDSLKIQAHFLKGFSDGSPDYGFGAMIISYF